MRIWVQSPAPMLKRTGMVTWICNPGIRELEAGRSLGFTLQPAWPNWQWRALPLRTRWTAFWEMIPEIVLWPLNASTHMCMHLHTHTHIPAHTHTNTPPPLPLPHTEAGDDMISVHDSYLWKCHNDTYYFIQQICVDLFFKPCVILTFWSIFTKLPYLMPRSFLLETTN